jgi:hypothetical protein
MNPSNTPAGSYHHFPSPMKSYVLSVIAILLCAVPSAYVAWQVWLVVGLSGVGLSIATAFSAMVLATAMFALLSAIRNKLSGAQRKS